MKTIITQSLRPVDLERFEEIKIPKSKSITVFSKKDAIKLYEDIKKCINKDMLLYGYGLNKCSYKVKLLNVNLLKSKNNNYQVQAKVFNYDKNEIFTPFIDAYKLALITKIEQTNEDIKAFSDVLKSSSLRVSEDHIIGKVDQRLSLENYRKVNHIPLETDKKGYTTITTENKSERGLKTIEYTYIKVNDSFYNSYHLTEIAKDAKINKLLKNAKLQTLLLNAEFYADKEKGKPLLIIIGNTSYFIAPLIEDF